MTDQLAIVPKQEGVQLGSIIATSSQDVIARASIIATQLTKIVKERKLSKNISGREYVYVDGWETMGAMLGIIPREVSVSEQENGDFEAVVELIRTSDGAIVGRGSAIVGSDERTWSTRPRYARRSMAVTRATGKAYRISFSWIMSLAGYATTPAEEMDGIVDAEYEDVKPVVKVTQPVKPPAPNGHKAGITLEEACAIKATDGTKYGDIPTSLMRNKLNAMANSKKDLTDDALLKIEAMKMILKARADGTLPEPAGAVEQAQILGEQPA